MSEGPDHDAKAASETRTESDPSETDFDESDSEVVRGWLKRSLDESHTKAPDLLAGVQRRIRDRSRGKFFADGWSTTQARTSYVLVGLVTLILVALAYAVLTPWNIR